MTTTDAPERLDRDQVIEATLTLIARHGVSGLTMRMLGEALGRSTMATYRHVANKEELLALTADAVLGRITLPAKNEGTPEERLRLFGRSAFTEMAAHPWVAPFMLSHRETTPNAERLLDGFIGIVSEVVPDRSRARKAAGAIRAYLIGGLGASGLDRPDEAVRKKISAAARAHFEFGLDAMISGALELARRSD